MAYERPPKFGGIFSAELGLQKDERSNPLQSTVVCVIWLYYYHHITHVPIATLGCFDNYSV